MLSIEDFVYRNFDQVQPYGNPVTDLRVDCPQCDDLKQHLHISLDKQVAHCFRCGYSASWARLVMDITGFEYWRAMGELYVKPRAVRFDALLKESVNTHHKTQAVAPKVELPRDFVNLNVATSRMARAARLYLEQRRFGSEYIELYNLGLASDTAPGRVIIPVEGSYWQGRSIFKWLEPKYINPKVDAGSFIFNAGALECYDEIVVCEGAFSAMAVGLNAVALIGKEGTPEKLARLKAAHAKRFIIALEPGAYGTMSKVANTLERAGKQVVIWKYITGDPAEADSVYTVMDYDLKAKILLALN